MMTVTPLKRGQPGETIPPNLTGTTRSARQTRHRCECGPSRRPGCAVPTGTSAPTRSRAGSRRRRSAPADRARCEAGACPGPPDGEPGAARLPGGDQIPPVRRVFGAAGLPPVLPAAAGLGLQPVEHGDQAKPPALPANGWSSVNGGASSRARTCCRGSLGGRPRRDKLAAAGTVPAAAAPVPLTACGMLTSAGKTPHQPREAWQRRHRVILAEQGLQGPAQYSPSVTAPGRRPACRAWNASTAFDHARRAAGSGIALRRGQTGMSHYPLQVGQRHGGIP